MQHLSRYYRDSLCLDRTEEGRNFLSAMRDVLTLPAFRALAEYRHHRSVDRRQHALSVAYLSYRVCLSRGLLAEEAARAALLHDLFFYDRAHPGAPAFLYYRHPRIALENARRCLALTPTEEDAILHHMWPMLPVPPRTTEGRVVSRMDKYCAVREFFRATAHRRKTTAMP